MLPLFAMRVLERRNQVTGSGPLFPNSVVQDNYLGRRLTDRRTAEALDIAVGDLA
jgi:hypothetical protein